MRRPAPATVISIVALLFAMSGTAMAATGGDFILGTANTESSMSSLTNTKGSALSLSSASKAPPLKVSNSVQIPNLNASELGGFPASGFLLANGTAANANELGGVAPSGYTQGSGNISDGRVAIPYGAPVTKLVSAQGSMIEAECGSGAATGGDALVLTTVGIDVFATWWNPGGVGQTTLTPSNDQVLLDGTIPATTVVEVQVDTGNNIATYTVTESYNAATGSCTFTGQAVNSDS